MKASLFMCVFSVLSICGCKSIPEPPTIPCSMADAQRLITLANMGKVDKISFDISVFFNSKDRNEVNGKAHAEAIKAYMGYLASLKADGKISDEALDSISKHIKNSDRCK